MTTGIMISVHTPQRPQDSSFYSTAWKRPSSSDQFSSPLSFLLPASICFCTQKYRMSHPTLHHTPSNPCSQRFPNAKFPLHADLSLLSSSPLPVPPAVLVPVLSPQGAEGSTTRCLLCLAKKLPVSTGQTKLQRNQLSRSPAHRRRLSNPGLTLLRLSHSVPNKHSQDAKSRDKDVRILEVTGMVS